MRTSVFFVILIVSVVGVYAVSAAGIPANPTFNPGDVSNGPCGTDVASVGASSQLTVSHSLGTVAPTCLSIKYTNTGNTPVYVSSGTFVVTDASGLVVFNATAMASEPSEILPGQSWYCAAFWNVSPSTVAGDRITVSVPLDSGQGATSVEASASL